MLAARIHPLPWKEMRQGWTEVEVEVENLYLYAIHLYLSLYQNLWGGCVDGPVKLGAVWLALNFGQTHPSGKQAKPNLCIGAVNLW